MDGKMTL